MQKNKFPYAFKVVWGLIGLSVAAFVLMYILSLMNIDWRDDWFFLAFSFPLCLFSVVLLIMLYSLRSTYAEELKEIEEGTCLAHWTYSEDEWVAFHAREWKKTRRRAIYIPLGFLAFFLFLLYGDPDAKDLAALVTPWAFVFTGGLIALMLFYTSMVHRRTKSCAREISIGAHGVMYGGYYSTWRAPGTRKGGAKMLPGKPSVVEIEVKVWGRYGSSQKPVRIPVPAGREQEAAEVVAKLNAA